MTSIVACAIGGAEYAIPGEAVQVVARAERMQCGEGANGLKGTLLVDGRSIPVFDLAAVLGHIGGADGRPMSSGGHIVVIHDSRGSLGWLVERLARVQLDDDAVVLPLPPIVGDRARAWFQGILRIGSRSMLVLATGTRVATEPAPSTASARTVPQGATIVVTFESTGLPRCEATRYALSARQIAAAVQTLPVIPVPGARPHVAGVAPWQREALPVFDFRSDTAVERGRNHDRYLIARCSAALGAAPIAFPIESDVRLYRPVEQDRQIAGAGPPPAFIAGIFSVTGDRVALLDLDALVQQP